MGGTIQTWQRLGDRQKLVVGFIGAGVATWAIGKVCDVIGDRVPALWFLGAIAHLISTLLMNWYVGCAAIGAILVAFGPNIWRALKGIRGRHIGAFFIALFPIGGIAMILMVAASATYQILWEPAALYTAPASAAVNPNGTKRIFTAMTPRQIARLYENGTQILADQQLRSEVGKWIAITGDIYAVRTNPNYEDKGLQVELGDISTGSWLSALYFDDRWISRFAVPKGTRIYAVCKVSYADVGEPQFNSCELAPP